MLDLRLRINLHQQPLRQIGIISSISCQECQDATASASRAPSLTYWTAQSQACHRVGYGLMTSNWAIIDRQQQQQQRRQQRKGCIDGQERQGEWLCNLTGRAMTMNVKTNQMRREMVMVEMMGNNKDNAFNANARSRVPGKSRHVDRSAHALERNGRGNDVAMDRTCDDDERECDNQPIRKGRPQRWRWWRTTMTTRSMRMRIWERLANQVA